MRTTLMERDLTDVIAGTAHNVHVLDVQPRPSQTILAPSTWDTVVFVNNHDTKIVLRQHRLSGAIRLKAIPPKTIDLMQPESYEIELFPDVPLHVLHTLLENLK